MDTRSEHFFKNPYHWRLRLHMIICAVWPYSQRTFRVPVTLMLITVSYLFASLQVIRVMKNNSMNILTESIPLFTFTIGFHVKHMGCFLQMKKAKHLLECIKADWMRKYTTEELEILHKYMRKGKSLTEFYFYLMEVSLFSLTAAHCLPDILDAIAPLNESRTRIFLLEAEYFLDRDKYYYVILTSIVITIQICIFVITGIDFMYMYSVVHACAMCKIVGHKLEHAFDETEPDTQTAWEIERKYQANLANCIQCHNRLLAFVSVLNSVVSNSFAVQYTMGIIGVSASYFIVCAALLEKHSIIDIAIRILLIVECVVLFFITCVPSQMLGNCSMDIPNEAYFSNWTAASPKLRKFIIFIIMRTSEPLKLYMGHYVVMSFETYGSVIQLTMSFFMMLFQVRIN